MGCCQKFLRKIPYADRSTICLKWVLPIRILVLISLAAHLCIYLFLVKDKITLLTFLIIIHFVIAISLLKECRRSVDFHRQLDKEGSP